MREVAIIGCGPAGLLAAHAVTLAGLEPVVFSKDAEPSPRAAATFLHRAIPELTRDFPDDYIRFIKRGDAHGYAQKVYGDPEAPTSWAKFGEQAQPAWQLSPVYADLWDRYGGEVRECEITARRAVALAEDFPAVINTAPAPAICFGDCDFPSRQIWIREGAEIGTPRNSMVYSGSPLDAWYRSSDLFGVESAEYGHFVRDARRGMKVLPTNCRCHPTIIRAGRWGTWRPGVLLHQAYEVAEANAANLNAEYERSGRRA